MNYRFIPIVAHITGWILFFSLVIGFVSHTPVSRPFWEIIGTASFVIFCLSYLFIFYFNYSWLLPNLYLAKNYGLYAVCVVALFVTIYFTKPFDKLMNEFRQQERTERDFRPPPPPNGSSFPPPGDRFPGPPSSMGPGQPPKQTDIVSIILFVTVWSFGTSIFLVRQWRESEQRATRAEADKVNAELIFLRAQINPHFLFNTLNNIYSLAVTHNEHTAESIMKLSNIMRYITEDTRQDFVSLNSEIECIRDYIDLQRLRLGQKMTVDLSITGDPFKKSIAPLILMTFIENVFKYGVSSHSSAFILINIHIEPERILFLSQNTIFPGREQTERKGIGLENTKKRLEHLYPGKHHLDINQENNLFTVQLSLQSSRSYDAVEMHSYR